MIGFWWFLKKSQQTVQKMAQLNEKKKFFLSIKEKEGMTRHQWNNWDAEAKAWCNRSYRYSVIQIYILEFKFLLQFKDFSLYIAPALVSFCLPRLSAHSCLFQSPTLSLLTVSMKDAKLFSRDSMIMGHPSEWIILKIQVHLY